MKREKRNQRSEAHEQKGGQRRLCSGSQRIRFQISGQHPPIQSPGHLRDSHDQSNQSDQKHQAPEHEIKGHSPGRTRPVPLPPDPDQKKTRNQSHLMKGEEIKKINGEECAQSPESDQ